MKLAEGISASEIATLRGSVALPVSRSTARLIDFLPVIGFNRLSMHLDDSA
ncbi:MAG: hypothetical protein V3S62_06425 [Acidimicrobiia bacterium]